MRKMPTVPYGNMERKKDGKYEWLRNMWNSIIFLMGILKEKLERMREKQYSKMQQMRTL